jgi:DNA repair exonuclease SbcCD nuclease subunit|tara:strand:+ start:2567 stop:5758 length:3192 start_codon:yes stop_codon:yes gene_type:complete
MIKKIQLPNTVDYIFHIADVHIRNWKRHKEFKQVFDKMFKELEKCSSNTIVTVGGDIVHAKTEMSPELINMVSYLFEGLADRRPTFVITGNHDANLNNPHRLDALTPIVEGLRHPDLYYLRDSGLYELEAPGQKIGLSVFSLLGETDDYITYDKIDNPDQYDLLMALYHGTVANSKVDSGMNIEHGLSWDKFAGFDLAPLGDIHKRQVLSAENPLMFYPGSTVQQNFGEAYEGHGYGIIDIRDRKDIKYEFHDLPNEYGYYTLEVTDGVLADNLPITKNTRLRIKTINTDAAQMKRILATIRKKYKNRDAIVIKLDKGSKHGDNHLNAQLDQGDVRNLQYQNQLLTDYLTDEGVDQDSIDKVLKINKKLNQELQQPEAARNVVWKPKKFEFSNMFSYGENNTIDFSTKMGTCGIFAPNHAGKSAILDALCFCLFDHSFRASKADQVLNRKKESFECTFNFELEGLDYFIHKKAFKYRSGALKGRLRVEIDFWYINEDGDKVSLNGEQRRDTDKIIQSYVGTFDDFILTALSLQQNNSNFIDKTQSERKDLLANFLDVTIFDQLHDLANKNNRNAAIVLEEYQKQDFETKLGDAENSLGDYTQKHDDAVDHHKTQKAVLDDQIDKIIGLSEKIEQCDEEDLDIDQLNTDLETHQENLKTLQADKKTSTKNWEAAKKKLTGLEYDKERALNSFDTDLYNDYQTKTAEKVQLDTELGELKITIKNKLSKLEKLNKHEYDPNCSYCTSNVFVQDAITTKQELEDDKTTVADFLQKRMRIVDFIEDNKEIQDQAEYIKTLATDYNAARADKSDAESEYEKLISKIATCKQSITDTKADIRRYNKSLKIIERNKIINEKVNQLNKEKNKQSIIVQKANKSVRDFYAKKCVAEETIEECTKTIQHMTQLVEDQYIYDLYCKAMYKDGIPFQLISKAVPYIEQHANIILNQIIDFEIALETDGKNINGFICYEDEKWPLELSSGMERFLSSIALRIALIKITNLPKPDFIAIDEGLGVLDSTNLNSMHTLFTNMKDIFRFSLVISHIDVVRDMVDSILTIDRKNDLSYINC